MTTDERTPLLHGAPSQPALADESAHQQTEPVPSTPTHFTLPKLTRRTITLTTLTLLLLTFLVSFPILYFVYIPSRLQQGANAGTPDITLLSIHSLLPSSIDVRIKAKVHNSDIPPVDVIMEPCLYNVRANKKGEREASVNVASLQFPGLVTKKGEQDAFLDFRSSMEVLNRTFVREALDGLVEGRDREVKVFEVEANPVMRIPHLGSWVIQMLNRVVVDPANTTTPDPTPFNATLDSYSYTLEPLPSGLSLIRVLATNSFTNPYPVILHPQNFSLHFSIHYEEERILNVTIPSESMRLDLGRNVGRNVSAESVPEGTMKLMKLVGEYAEGKNSTVVIKDIGMGYEQGREKL
ncbi:hypothetical protein HK097_002000, partial [Rhizophlyctis rosea]